MVFHRIASGMVLSAACLASGCSDPNSGKETDLAKLPLPAGVDAKPQEKPFKSRAKSSSPPLAQQPGAQPGR